MHIFIHHFVDVDFKNIFEFYVENHDQSDLNAPDVVITTCQFVSTSVPGGLERSVIN